MRQAREILREYWERRQSEGAVSSAALREENLRRLLRHVGAAHSPSEQLEARLLPAMLRAREERAGPRRPNARWPWLSRPAWQLWAPAAALAAGMLVFAARVPRPHPPAGVASLPRQQLTGRSIAPPPAVPAAQPGPLIGYVLTGELLRRHAGEPQGETIGSGAEIHLNDTVSTDANTAGRVVFLDDSVCSVLPDSTLQYTAPAHAALKRPSLLLLARGATWNTVEPGGPAFTVATRSATASVRGTEFGVAVDAAGKTTLRVTRGKVTLQAAAATVLVAAGMQAVALPGHAPQAPVLMVAAAKRPSSIKPQPGTPRITLAHPGRAPSAGSGSDGKSFRSVPVPAPKAAAPPDESAPTAPADSSSPPASSSSDHGTEPPPVSTSP